MMCQTENRFFVPYLINKVCSLFCTLAHKYTIVLSDNVDGGDDLDLIVTTMSGQG
jgi:hypothetical protein